MYLDVEEEKKILRFTLLSPSRFRLRFDFMARKKKREGVATSLMCCFVKYRFVCSFAFVFVEEEYTYVKRSLKRRNIEEKIRENKRKKKKQKTTKHDFLLLKYKIIIRTVHFFFFFIVIVILSYSKIYACLLLL